jgi:DNA-binding GntR family transcriptional regulator
VRESTGDPRKWVQVADYLRAQMDAGELKPGVRVSLKNESRTHGVGRDTVASALQALAAERRLKRFPGYGYIVAGWCPSCEDQFTSTAHRDSCGTGQLMQGSRFTSVRARRRGLEVDAKASLPAGAPDSLYRLDGLYV